MFKQIFIIVFIIIVAYFVIKRVLLLIHKLNISKRIIKNRLNDIDTHFLKKHSMEYSIDYLNFLKKGGNSKELLFYTDQQWSTHSNFNYILDIKKNKYYIIDSGYFYYIHNIDDFEFNILSENVKVKIFDFGKHIKKINYI
jgi:hypothetical protein